ncbi:MAG: alpha/beta hydrolase family protein [Actinomycetales bacterium]
MQTTWAGAEQTLRTVDGVTISAVHFEALDPHQGDLCFVVAHGFTGNWRQPRVRRVIERLRRFGAVVALDLRGHGRSGGDSTVGDAEVHDLDAALAWARELGYDRVVSVGFSMGASVAIRQAAVGRQPVDAVVCVSGPAYWYYRGTRVMRLVHHLVLTRQGRAALRLRGTRISSQGWPTPAPIQPSHAAGRLGSTPLLIVHGTADRYFPLEHPRALHRAAIDAGHPAATMWIVPGFGHAEAAIDPSILDAIAAWGAGLPVAADASWVDGTPSR